MIEHFCVVCLCRHHLITGLSSNLRPTTGECVHLYVTRGHFRSRDRDVVHTIQSATTISTRKLHGSKAYIAGIGIFDLFWSCNLHIRI